MKYQKFINAVKNFFLICAGAYIPIHYKMLFLDDYTEDSVWMFRFTCLAAMCFVIPVLSILSLFIPKNRFLNTGDIIVFLVSAFVFFLIFFIRCIIL